MNEERSLIEGLRCVRNFASILQLSDAITHRACEIYKEFEDKRPKAMRFQRKPVVAGALYMACKELHNARTVKVYRPSNP